MVTSVLTPRSVPILIELGLALGYPLDPGATADVRFSGIRLREGSHRIRVVADAREDVDESDEGNNGRERTVTCMRSSSKTTTMTTISPST